MASQKTMSRFARWHIWLAWLTGIPILMWTLTGLVMVAKPIEEVRGNHLRIERTEPSLPTNNGITIDLAPAVRKPVKEITATMWRGAPVTRITFMDGSMERFDAMGRRMPALDEPEIRAIVAEQIVGGDRIETLTFFDADEVPQDFRRPSPVWQARLADGTHVYIGAQSGEVEAVRTRWWRVFDVMWGLHIMDLQTREDTHHPTLIVFAVLALLGSLFGTVLMFRRRKARVKVPRKAATHA